MAELVNSQCNEYEFLQSLTSFCYNYISKKYSSGVRDVKKRDQWFSVTWEVGRWEWILYFIDIRLKLINFELKKRYIYIYIYYNYSCFSVDSKGVISYQKEH